MHIYMYVETIFPYFPLNTNIYPMFDFQEVCQIPPISNPRTTR